MRYDEPIGGGPNRQTERINANLKRKSEAFIAAGCPGMAPDEAVSAESQRRLRALFDSWREPRPHWTEECYEAFCAGCLEGYSSKVPGPKEYGSPRGMKDGESCFMIERTIEGWPHWACWDATNENPFQWTNDPNAALHFADMASCDQICAEMPDAWDVKITGHSWMDADAEGAVL